MLEKIIFRQMDEPAKKAAFKNDEIDAAAAGTASAYSEFKAVQARNSTRECACMFPVSM